MEIIGANNPDYLKMEKWGMVGDFQPQKKLYIL